MLKNYDDDGIDSWDKMIETKNHFCNHIKFSVLKQKKMYSIKTHQNIIKRAHEMNLILI